MSTPPSPPPADPLAEVLRRLYAEQMRVMPHDLYFRDHAAPRVIDTQVSVFRWYAPLLLAGRPPTARVLDWGSRHAPDACLFRASCGHELHLHASDLDDPTGYAPFHQFAGVEYAKLDHVYRLPYPDDLFDAVVGSGTLEHTAMDYESLKELWRVLKPGGRLAIAYLPNRWSIDEWRRRRQKRHGAHPRLYTRGELRHLLLHTGFRLVADGYQTRYDALHGVAGVAGWKRAVVKAAGLHRFTSTLCAVAEKVTAMV